MTGLHLSRDRIVASRLRSAGVDRRRELGAVGFGAATHAGVQDSMPRAAVLSLHARLHGVDPEVLDDHRLEQVWGPRFSAYVVAAGDRAPFTLGRMPRRGARRERALRMADDLRSFLDGRTITYAEAGTAMGVDPNALRYGTTTGTIVIRWVGSGRPTVTSVEPPDVDEEDARLELARRFLHVFGPATIDEFSRWAGVNGTDARTTFDGLASELVSVETPIGDALMQATDEAELAHTLDPIEGVRLLPSGDAVYLRWGAQRELFVADETRRNELWTSRVWPGALLVDGEIMGTWSRRGTRVELDPWSTLSSGERATVDEEISKLPLP